jgi:hypothetical protein
MKNRRLWKETADIDLKLPTVRIYYVIFVILIPVSLLIINPFSMMADWQSGRWQDIWALWLSHKVHWIFWPTYIWSVVALILLIKDYRENSNKLLVRWGVYVGTFWCWMYLVYELILFMPGILIGTISLEPMVLVLGSILIGAGWYWRKKIKYKHLLGISLVVMLVFVVLFSNPTVNNYFYFNKGIWFLILVLVPPSATWLATILSVKIYRTQGNRYGWKNVLIFWGYASLSLTESVFRLISEYNKLPKTPPSCFIVTAATTGHTIVVGREKTQLRNFENFEKLLMVKKPYLHYRLRRIYNYAGPVVANIINKNRFLADLTYILLKPVEWIFGLRKHLTALERFFKN